MTACGQGDGCGGTCSSSDAGAPGTLGLSPADGGTVYVTAAEVFAQAIVRAVKAAKPAGGLPAANEQ